jgi:transposase-like protein
MDTRTCFTSELKHEAVQLLASGSRPSSEIAREFGIACNQLCKWQPELLARGSGAFPGSGARQGAHHRDRATQAKAGVSHGGARHFKFASRYFAKESF